MASLKAVSVAARELVMLWEISATEAASSSAAEAIICTLLEVLVTAAVASRAS